MQTNSRTLREPFGFDQGDPLIVCCRDTPEALREAIKRLRIKGYYCGYGSSICARQFGKVYFDIHSTTMSRAEFVMFWRWISENVATSLSPGENVEYIFV